MNKLNIVIMALFMSLTALADSQNSIQRSELKSMHIDDTDISIANIEKAEKLEGNEKEDIRVSYIQTYYGQSTDVSPKYSLYLAYYNGGEMNNSKTVFDLGVFWSIESVKRKKAGVYEVKGVRFAETGEMYKVKITVNAYRVYLSDRNAEYEDFSDPYFTSTLYVKEERLQGDVF